MALDQYYISVLHEVYPSLFFIIPKGIVIEVNNKYC